MPMTDAYVLSTADELRAAHARSNSSSFRWAYVLFTADAGGAETYVRAITPEGLPRLTRYVHRALAFSSARAAYDRAASVDALQGYRVGCRHCAGESEPTEAAAAA